MWDFGVQVLLGFLDHRPWEGKDPKYSVFKPHNLACCLIRYDAVVSEHGLWSQMACPRILALTLVV